MWFSWLKWSILATLLLQAHALSEQELISEGWSIDEDTDQYDYNDLSDWDDELELDNVTMACPFEDDWYYSITSGSCYKLSEDKANFVDALENCRDGRSRLAEINDQITEVMLKTLFTDEVRVFWVGALRSINLQTLLTRKSEYNNLTLARYSNFKDTDTHSGCVGLESESTKKYWKAFNCSRTFYYVCEKRALLDRADNETRTALEGFRTYSHRFMKKLTKQLKQDNITRHSPPHPTPPPDQELTTEASIESVTVAGSAPAGEDDLIDGIINELQPGSTSESSDGDGDNEQTEGDNEDEEEETGKGAGGKGKGKGKGKKLGWNKLEKKKKLRKFVTLLKRLMAQEETTRSRTKRATYSVSVSEYDNTELCLLSSELSQISSLTMSSLSSCV